MDSYYPHAEYDEDKKELTNEVMAAIFDPDWHPCQPDEGEEFDPISSEELSVLMGLQNGK